MGERGLAYLEAEARRFAEFYPQSSDGRNTFIIFADKIAAVKAQEDRGMTDDEFKAGIEALRRDWGTVSVDRDSLGILRAANDPTTGLLAGMRAPILAEIINRALAGKP